MAKPRFYRTYPFRGHDPVIAQVETLVHHSGMTLNEAADKSGVARSTLRNWRNRKTKRPYYSTVKAVSVALGGSLAIVYQGRIITSSDETPPPKPQPPAGPTPPMTLTILQ